jgi:hypothetical protein
MISPPAVSPSKVQNYICAKHYLIPGTQIDSIIGAAQSLVGLHAARLPTPYTTLFSRLKSFQPSSLRHCLFQSRELIKIRCMRQTLHILPLNLAPIAHQATLKLRLYPCLRYFRQLSLDPQLLSSWRLKLSLIFPDQPFTPPEFVTKFLASLTSPLPIKSDKSLFFRMLLKYFWEIGDLSYLNLSSSWSREQRSYALTSNYYPHLDLNRLDSELAQLELVYLHIASFGPVLPTDTSWWSGLTLTTVKRCLDQLISQNRIVPVSLTQIPSYFYMTTSDYQHFSKFVPPEADWLTLLAYEDPTLKGYYSSRFRYIDSANYSQLFNQIGEARPSIMINGKIAGIWNWDKRCRKITTNLFEYHSHFLKRELKVKVRHLEDILNSDL